MEKLNIAEILRHCPKGMELDCTMYEDVYFDYVDELNIIHCYIQHETFKTSVTFNLHGAYNSNVKSKCVILPKGKTTWEGFQRPFRDGDILTNERGSICIYKGPMYYSELLVDFYCGYRISDEAFVPKLSKDKHFGNISEYRLATEEEKQKLFDVIKENGYKWNTGTNTLEKLIVPKFKVGDRVKHKESYISGVVIKIDDESYKIKYDSNAICFANIKYQDDYELVPNKFDITTLKPFESRVLVRTSNKWVAAFYSHYDKEAHLHYCVVGGLWYKQCIPYNDETKHLLDTTNDCDEFYKTWE